MNIAIVSLRTGAMLPGYIYSLNGQFCEQSRLHEAMDLTYQQDIMQADGGLVMMCSVRNQKDLK